MNQQSLKIYCDGGARGNPGPGASAFVVTKDTKVVYGESRFLANTTNNFAEYNAVLMALNWLQKNEKFSRGKTSVLLLDSELVVKQLNGEYKIKNEKLKLLAMQAKKLEEKLGRKVFYKSIPRSKNVLPDSLVNKEIDENLNGFHVQKSVVLSSKEQPLF